MMITMRTAAAVSLFLGASGVSVIYSNEHAEVGLALVAMLAVAMLGAGFLARSTWILLLAPIPILIAVPFGFQDEYLGSDAERIWTIQLSALPFYLLFMAIGIFLSRRRASPSGHAETP